MMEQPDASTRTPIAPTDLVTLDSVRMNLARVWLLGSGGIFLVMVIQSLHHAYGDLTQEAWGWFLPTLLPSLGLIVTVLTYTALDPLMTGFVVRKSFATLATWLSVTYLFTVALTILMQPFSGRTPADAVGLMRLSNLWLGPLQGIVASSLGVLFTSKERK